MRFEIPKFGGGEKKPDEPEFTRRQALRIGVGAAAAGVTAGVLLEKGLPDDTETEKGPVKEKEAGYEESELFERQISGYKVLYGKLERDEILFVDEEGVPIGKPVQIKPLDGIKPGKIDDEGILEGEFNQEWLDREREQICAKENVPCDIPNALPRQLNTIPTIREAVYKSPGKAELNPKTFLDVVHHYGRKKVVNGDGENRIEYVKKYAMQNTDLPEELKKDIASLLPGLAAQESKFNNDARSSVNAMGIFQFMPATWAGLGYDPGEIALLSKQVEAVGKYFTYTEKRLKEKAEFALGVALKEYFGGDEKAFEKYFLTPVLLNTYNSGADRLAEVVRWFTDHYPDRAALEGLIGSHQKGFGLDAYAAMAKEASKKTDEGNAVSGYGKDSSEYVSRIYALAELLKNE